MFKNTLTVLLLLFIGQALAENLLTGISSLQINSLTTTERAAITAHLNIKPLINRKTQVGIELPSGQQLAITYKSIDINHLGGYSWQGHVSGDDSQSVTLSIYDDAIAGSIHTDTAIYEIQPLGNHRIKLVELNPQAFPECAGGEAVLQPMTEGQRPLNTITNNRATNTVDVIVVYTPEARVGGGGHSGIKATAQAAVDAMNSSLVNSQVDTEIVLLYAGEVNYNDSNDSSADLDWLRYSAEVENLKNQYGADMAGLLVESMGGCGRGYVMRSPGPGFRDWAVQVTRRSCAVGNLSFAHEFGHNMGLGGIL